MKKLLIIFAIGLSSVVNGQDTTALIAQNIDTLWTTAQEFVVKREQLKSALGVISNLEQMYATRDTNYYSTLETKFNGEWVFEIDGELKRFATVESPTVAVEVNKNELLNTYDIVDGGTKLIFEPRRKDLSVFRLAVGDNTYIMAYVRNGLFAALSGEYLRKVQ